MTFSLHDIPLAMLLGIGATAVMDAWLLLLKRLGVPTLNFAFIGRWVGHLLRGQVAHAAIAKAAPVRGELAWGWLTHYAVGVVFAGVLLSLQGAAWVHSPALCPRWPWAWAPWRRRSWSCSLPWARALRHRARPPRSRTACAALPTTPCLAWACISPRWSSH